MIQAFASLLGVFAIIYGAKLASNTFLSFRKEKQEERRLDAVHQILAFVYRFSANLKSLRRSVLPDEFLKAESEARMRFPKWDEIDPEDRQSILTSDVMLDRLMANAHVWNQIFEKFPAARAYLDQQSQDDIEELWEMLGRFEWAARALIDEKSLPPMERVEALKTIWKQGLDDKFESQIDAVVKRLEEKLAPTLRPADIQ